MEEWTIEWPVRYAHWQPVFESELFCRLAQDRLRLLGRWPRTPGPKPRLIVCRHPGDAAIELEARGLRADPRVPRTFPTLRLAIVPLPFDDGLLASLSVPPQTWTESLMHEWAHLLAAGRPGLDDAPLWFHEGLAESFSNSESAFPRTLDWPIPAAGALPSEELLMTWRFWAWEALGRTESPTPWETLIALTADEGRRTAERGVEQARARGIPTARPWRGRDAHADPKSGLYLAAAMPGQVVEVDLPALEPGAAIEFELRPGLTGRPDAGLRIVPLLGPALRLRCDSYGGLAAWLEDPSTPRRNDSTDRAGVQSRAGTTRTVRIEHRGDSLAVISGNFLFRQALAPAAHPSAISLILYASNGAFCAQRLP